MLKKTERPIPELTDVSPEYARLLARQNDLAKRNAELDQESRDIKKEIAAEQARDFHKERIHALVEGMNYEPPLPVREKMGKIAREKQDIENALHHIANLLSEERRKASRIVVSEFAQDHSECAAEFFSGITAAAKAHIKYSQIRRRLESAGIDAAGFYDFGFDLFGHPDDRNNDVSYAFRDALKRSYITASEIPSEYK